MINQNVKQVMMSKQPMEAFQKVLKTYKQAFKSIVRSTIFVTNRELQTNVFKDITVEQKRLVKVIQMGERHEVIYGIFEDEKEYCKPSFNSLKSAGKAQYCQRLIYIPIFYDQLLMFAIQLEQDDAKQPEFSNKKKEDGTVSPLRNKNGGDTGRSNSIVKQGTVNQFSRTNTLESRKKYSNQR